MLSMIKLSNPIRGRRNTFLPDIQLQFMHKATKLVKSNHAKEFQNDRSLFLERGIEELKICEHTQNFMARASA